LFCWNDVRFLIFSTSYISQLWDKPQRIIRHVSNSHYDKRRAYCIDMGLLRMRIEFPRSSATARMRLAVSEIDKLSRRVLLKGSVTVNILRQSDWLKCVLLLSHIIILGTDTKRVPSSDCPSPLVVRWRHQIVADLTLPHRIMWQVTEMCVIAVTHNYTR
jgi:hypothetical protein